MTQATNALVFENLLYEKKDGVAYVTVNRSNVLNQEGVMSKLHFDRTTYQFYVRSGQEESTRAKAAGFRLDPLRRRYYTAAPSVAKCVADCGDRYVKHLLADVLGVTVVPDLRTASPDARMQ